MRILERARTTEPLHFCLRTLSIPPSSYYYTRSRPEKDKTLQQQKKYKGLRKKVERIIKKHASYGYRRIQQELAKKGVIINHKPLKKLLKLWNLEKKRKIRHSKPNPLAQYLKELGAKANLASRLKNPRPLQLIFADFARIACQAGIYWLILFSDHTSRLIPGWNIEKHRDTANALRAYRRLKRKLKKFKVRLAQVVIHQDQDKVFTGYEYAGTLLNDDINLSFTEHGFKDNPNMESCIGHFKEEYGDLLKQAKSLKELKKITAKSVRDWNKEHIHSSLKGRSPEEFIHTFYRLKKS